MWGEKICRSDYNKTKINIILLKCFLICLLITTNWEPQLKESLCGDYCTERRSHQYENQDFLSAQAPIKTMFASSMMHNTEQVDNHGHPEYTQTVNIAT